ncbi:DUF4271 domain-containing protein [Prevotella sp. PMUR]|uniref:DUF4271 domain-containing protein n=2 Tax=Xylanibacter muris TaxID=2736290 RepID=A0ABX2AKH0_9BACT|nr:DUF4271 domain-containing protein [Xylanibacter muris]
MEQVTVPEQAAPVASKPRHPYEVLRMLPRDATPAQQDSAIQAVFKPKEIRYSSRPDTLHLPGHKPGKSIKDVRLPLYYKETFFSESPMLHPEVKSDRSGVAGDPVPYTMRTDNFFNIILIVCFILASVSIGHSRNFIIRQFKSFVYYPAKERVFSTETSNEVHFQVLLLLQTCLQVAVIQYFLTLRYIGVTFVLSSDYQLIGVYLVCVAAYFLLKWLLYSFVNIVFFNSKINLQWVKAWLFLTAFEGILLFPIVLLQIYFDLDVQYTMIYFIIVLIFVKLLTFYKSCIIFLRQKVLFLQIILYFCALEMVPLALLFGFMVAIGNYLNVNF